MALFLYLMRAGIRKRVRRIIECVGPRCSSPGIRKSMSAITEAARSIGIFASKFRSLDAAFPVRYPKAKCPTANVEFSPFFYVLEGKGVSFIGYVVFDIGRFSPPQVEGNKHLTASSHLSF